MTAAAHPPAAVTVRAPAKVNIELRVGPTRSDGFHSLATVYQAVSIYDEVTVRPSDDWAISIGGSRALGVPADESNLAMRAARILAQDTGEDPVAIHIEKEIPVAGGMAGGSADAAAVLVACDRLWGLGLEIYELEEYAQELGSDVPFLLHGGTAVGTGRGELIAPALTRGTYHWVFVTSDRGLSTPEVYRELDRIVAEQGRDLDQPSVSPGLLAALRAGAPLDIGQFMRNDLEEAAFSLRDDLSSLAAAGMQYGALASLVSGSGPTMAFLARSHEHAIDLAVALTASGAATEVHRASGPVPGATVWGVPRVD